MTKKSSSKFPNRWAGDPDKFDFTLEGRPAILPEESAVKPASKKQALAEQLKNVLGKEQK